MDGMEQESRDWIKDANCRSSSPDIFYNPSNDRNEHRKFLREEAAKAICSECTVINECLDYALHTNQPDGVWGGMGVDERKRLIRQQRRRTSPRL